MNIAKSYDQTLKTSTIKLNKDGAWDEAVAKSVYALIGGYNEVARSVDINEFNELEAEFADVVKKMAHKLYKA